MAFMSNFSTPKAPTPEKQAEFDAFMTFLIDRANATAQGKGPGPRMTAAQSATQDEMLALANVQLKEAAGLEALLAGSTVVPPAELAAYEQVKDALDEAFAKGGLPGVFEAAAAMAEAYGKK